MILEEATKEAYGYYARDLKPQSHKLTITACDDCGKVRIASKNGYRALCISCANKGKNNPRYGKHLAEEHKAILSLALKGENNPRYGKSLPEETKALMSAAQKGRIFTEEHKANMCKNHAEFKGENHPNWQGGTVTCCCKQCGVTFQVRRGEFNSGNGKFCSHSCTAKARLHNAKPKMTKPEIKFQSICQKYDLPFYFVGDGALWLGNANPDFVHNTKKIVVEVFGDYWHSPLLRWDMSFKQTRKYREKQFKVEGYKTVILWESDLKSKDAEAFVMHTLHKEGVI